jgi:tetratricopeptide (TPR) repeat protein
MRHCCRARVWALAGALSFGGGLLLNGCTTSPQVKEAKALERGKKFAQQKDYARAMLEFKNAARAVPSDAEPYFQMALVSLDSGNTRVAYQMLVKAVELDPRHTGARSRLAELIVERGSAELLPEAERTAKDILSRSPDNVDALNTLALLELRLGRRGDAESYLDRALEKDPESLRSSVLLSKLKMSTGDLPAAEKILREAALRSPNSPDAWVALGNFYAVNDRISDAVEALGSALRVKPQYALALISMAEVQYRAGQKERAEETFRQISALPDPRYEPLYGSYLFAVGKRDAALGEFERLARKHPKDRAGRTRLIETYLALGRVGDAEQVITRALKENPKDSDALLSRAYLWMLRRNYNEAQSDVNRVLQFQPRSAEAHFLLSKIQQARGYRQSERQELTDALQINPDLLAVRLALAENLALQSPKDALELLDKAPRRQSREVPLIVARNSCLLALGRNEEARKSLDAALMRARTPELLVQDGVLWLRLQQYDKGRAALKEAIEERPTDPRIVDLLARTYVAQKQPARALEFVREHAQKHAGAARIQQLLGAWLQRSGKLSEARAAFLSAKSADPAFLEADVALALLDIREQKNEAARQRLIAVLAANPSDTRARIVLAFVDESTHNYEAAVEQYRQILSSEPENILALNGLAYDLTEFAKKPDEALKYAQKAKELAPSDPRVADTLGWIYYQKGVYQSAVKQLEAAVAASGSLADEESGRVQYHLAMAYFRSGKPTQGKRILETAQKVAPSLPEAALAQELEKQFARP